MARIRTIKPEFPQSESIGRLSREARLLFVQLWTLVDDDGRARASSRLLASLLYPYDDDAPALIDGWLAELDHEHIVRYEHDGAVYLEIVNWKKHQKIAHPSASKLPGLHESSRILVKPRESSPGKGGEGTMDLDQNLSVASPPAEGPPELDSPEEPAQTSDTSLHAFRSEAAGIVRETYWQGNDPPPKILRKYPDWTMGRELSTWDDLVRGHAGEFTPAEINAGLRVVREIEDWGPDPPLSLLLFHVKGQRDKLRRCVLKAQQNQPTPEDHGHIGDILREAVNGGPDNGGAVEPGSGNQRARRNAHRPRGAGARARASPGN